ncbi:MAG: hypothetical protein AAGD96_12545 [Chloroflexota bacterium]
MIEVLPDDVAEEITQSTGLSREMVQIIALAIAAAVVFTLMMILIFIAWQLHRREQASRRR